MRVLVAEDETDLAHTLSKALIEDGTPSMSRATVTTCS